MEATRVFLESKSSISETSQATQTLPENENPMINNDTYFYHETPTHLDDCCENVIPQLPIHQSSPQRESKTVSTDCTNLLSCYDEHSASEAEDEPSVTDDHENNRSLLITHHHIQETTLSEDYEYSYEFSEDCSHLLSNENVVEPIQTHEPSPPSESLSPADMMNYCMNKLSQPNPIHPNDNKCIYTLESSPLGLYSRFTSSHVLSNENVIKRYHSQHSIYPH